MLIGFTKSSYGYVTVIVFLGVLLLLWLGWWFYWSPRQKLIRRIQKKIRLFVDNLRSAYPDDPRVKRLYHRHQHTGYKVNLEAETYTMNKGEKILMCVEDYSQNRRLHDDFNLLMFVALHELAHVMSVEVGHTEEFWQNFRFLLQVATEWKVYHPIDYNFSPTPYCKMTVTDNPFFHSPTLKDILWQLQNTV